MKIITFIRICLTMWLCWAIYTETGPFTAFGFFLIFVTIEMINAYIRKANKLAGHAFRELYRGEKK